MNGPGLTASRDALDTVLTLPDSVREEMARWLMPKPSKPNGHDPSPPVPTPLTPRTAKVPVARPPKPTLAQAAEQRLLQAMRDNPGLTVIALANALPLGDQPPVSACGSSPGARLSRRTRLGDGGSRGRGRGRSRALRRRRRADGGGETRTPRSPASGRACAVDSADLGLRAARDDHRRGSAIRIALSARRDGMDSDGGDARRRIVAPGLSGNRGSNSAASGE
jgi:hypothetical protein